jgi:ADP-heptose:LPS heptosyltransferase/glycosyltransferase involved in cell wall biosynthesis
VDKSIEGATLQSKLRRIIETGLRVVVITESDANLRYEGNAYYIIVEKSFYTLEETMELYAIDMIAYDGPMSRELVEKLCLKDTSLRLIYGLEDIDKRVLPSQAMIERRIAIITLNGIGDLLMLTPTLKILNMKGFEIDLVTYKPEVFENCPYVNKIITDPEYLDRSRYGKVIDITYSLSDYSQKVNLQHRVLAIAEMCGVKGIKDIRPEVFLTDAEIVRGKELIIANESKKTRIGVCFEACDERRMLMEHRQRELLEKLVKELPNANIYILGTDIRGVKNSGVIDLRGKTSAREMFGVVANLDVVISVDTGVFHVAEALKKKTILLNNLIPADYRKYDSTIVMDKFGTANEIIHAVKDSTHNLVKEDIRTKRTKVLYCRWDAGMGDLLMLSAGLKSIKEAYPNCILTFGCSAEYRDVVKFNPYIDNLITNEALIRKTDFDVVYDMTRFFEHEHYPMDKNPARNTSRIDLLFQDGLKIKANDRRPKYYLQKEETEVAKEWLEGKRRGKYLVGFHIDSNAIARNYPVDYFKKVQSVLAQFNVDVLLVGSSSGKQSLIPYKELKEYGLINATGLSIRETAALVNECDLMVCVDSGMLHLAAALEKKTIALFGTIRPLNRVLYYENCDELYPAGEMDCVPCNDALYIKKCSEVCLDLHQRRQPAMCMWRLTPERVYTKVLLDLGIKEAKKEGDRPKLSFAMMTHNEELWIKNCMDAIHDIADEIVIVDDSTDNTRKILKRYPKVKVYDVEKLPCPKECNYCKENEIKITDRPCSAKLRQQSFDKCTGDWIFRIDADEILTKDGAKKLRMLVDNAELLYPSVKIFWFPMVNFYLDDTHYKVGAQGHQWFPDNHKRLHKNEKRFHRWIQPAHERMVDYDIYGNIAYLDDESKFHFQHVSNWLMIYHYGYLQPKKTRADDAEKYKKMKVLLHTLDAEQVEEWFLSKPDIVLPKGWGTGICEYTKGEKG